MSKIFPGFVDMGEQGHHVLLKHFLFICLDLLFSLLSVVVTCSTKADKSIPSSSYPFTGIQVFHILRQYQH